MIRRLIIIGAGLALLTALWFAVLLGPLATARDKAQQRELQALKATALAQHESPEPLPSAEVDRILDEGMLGRLAFAIYEGRGLEELQRIGFEPELEIQVRSREDLGSFALFAPPAFEHAGWTGSLLISGRFQRSENASGPLVGCMAFVLDSGLLAWVNVTNDWYLQHVTLDFSELNGEFRYIATKNRQDSDYSFSAPQYMMLHNEVGGVDLRLFIPSYSDPAFEDDRYDVALAAARAAELADMPAVVD